MLVFIKITFFSLFILVPQISLAGDTQTLRFGILSIAQPSRIYAKWQPFADYMSQKLGKQVELVVPRGFGKMKNAIENGSVDFFYINSHVFYRLKQEGKAVGIAQMQNITGKTTSRSEIFVQRDSDIKKVSDLKNKKIAYISPMGAGGYLAPHAYLKNSGLSDSIEVFTKNLSNSIHGVLLGDYDAATMCGVNYKLMATKINTGELKIIAVSDEYPENVIGARPGLATQQIDAFRNELLTMQNKPDGQALLKEMNSMKIQKFVTYDESLEEITKELLHDSQL